MYYCQDDDTIIFYVDGGNIIGETTATDFLSLAIDGGNSLELAIQSGFMSSSSGSSGSLLSNISYDNIQVTYPTSTTEVYSYYNSAVLTATVTLTYNDATKANLVNVQRT